MVKVFGNRPLHDLPGDLLRLLDHVLADLLLAAVLRARRAALLEVRDHRDGRRLDDHPRDRAGHGAGQEAAADPGHDARLRAVDRWRGSSWARCRRWRATIGAIALFAVGEAMQAPRYYEYVADLAPQEQVGTYMGFAFLPVAIGTFVAGAIAGPLVTNYVQGSATPAAHVVHRRQHRRGGDDPDGGLRSVHGAAAGPERPVCLSR